MEVHLIDRMGTDLSVVNSARVSFSKESSLIDSDIEAPESESWYGMTGQKLYVQVLSEADQKLIKYLAKHNHFTPFTHVMITMREKVPIFVARQRFKHTIGFSYNEMSRRYVDEVPEFYWPEPLRSRPEGSMKQGSAGTHPRDSEWRARSVALCELSRRMYNEMIGDGIAPEQARAFLPQNTYTEFYVTGSLAAWARAYKLRSDSHAQKEIQDLATKWNKIIKEIPELQYSWKALTDA